MDWLRRNWPDLLIGIALIAVIAGIVATLLTGGSFFPINSGSSPSPAVTSPSVDPVPPTTDTTAPAGGVQPTQPAPGADAPAGTAGTDSGSGSAAGSTSDAGSAPGAVAVLPPRDDGTAPSAGGSDPVAPSSGSAASGTAAGSASAGTTPAAPAPATTTGNEGLPTDPYRVSVGAFGNEANARRQADRFREAGFPVFIGRQADLFLVPVGPYDTELQAEQAVAQIRNGDFGIDPVIYLFQPDAPGAAGATAAPETATTPTAPATTPAPAAAADGTYLQAGAYSTRESALPQIERLEALGFEVDERMEGGLLRLLVGPFSGDDLSEARRVLEDAGIEHFPRSQ